MPAKSDKDWNSTATATFTAIGTGNVITFSCSWVPGGPVGTRPYSHLRLTDANGNAVLSLSNNGQAKTLFINGNEGDPAASGNDWRSENIVWNVVAKLNMSSKKIETLTVTKSGESTPVVNQTNIDFQNEVTSISKFVCQTTKKSGYTVTSYLDNVSITYVDADPVANVTFKYEDNDGNSLSSLKADVVESHTVGDAISGLISSSLTSSFKNGDESIRYDYNTYTVSDDATSVPAGGATVTLKFTPKAKYTYTVNAVQNEDKTKTIKQLASGYVYAGDAVTIPYPHYFNVNDTLYTRGVTNKEYRQSITPSKDGYVAQFPYYASENVNIVYLSEGEDIEGATSSTSGNISVRASNAVAATHSGNLTITQLQAGTYKITAGLFQTSSANATANFTIGANVISLSTSNVNLNEKSSDEFTIASAQDVVWDGGSVLDYIYIQQIFTDADLAIAAGKDTKLLAVGDIWTIVKDTEFTTSSTGAVTLTSSNPAVATVDGMTVTAVGGGAATITINQAHDATYAASSAAITLKVLYDQTTVTGAETWDWTKTESGTAYMDLTNETTPAKDTEFVLKNVEIYGKSGAAYTIPTGFGDAQKLSVKGQYPFRYNSGGMFQGNTVKFTTEVPGVLAVDFSHTSGSGGTPRTLYINGVATSFTTENTTTVNAKGIVVPAGVIEITGNQGGSLAYLRIYKITFSTEMTDLQRAIADCQTYERSTEFATALAAESFSTAAEVYAFHTAWQIAQAKANGSTDLTKLIRNAAVADGTDWGGSSINHGEQYTGAPDEYYLDKYNGTINTNQTIYGVPAGTYKIKAATRSAANTSGTLYVNDGISDIAKVNQITSVGNTGGDLGNGWSWSEMTFTLTETKNLQVGFWADASSSKWAGCDDWHMELLGVSVTVGKNGYTTFASPYALDLTDENRPEGLKAYKATLSGSNLSFQQLHQTVPAGTGLLLLGETNDGTYNIPVVESGDDVETALTGVLTPTAMQSDVNGDYYFVMRKANSAEDALTFAPITTVHEVTIPAGKVYITVPSSAFVGGGARAIAVSFDDDETTGIDNLTPALSKGERVVYNLNGQRIDKPAKGLYIVNGKKVFVK